MACHDHCNNGNIELPWKFIVGNASIVIACWYILKRFVVVQIFKLNDN